MWTIDEEWYGRVARIQESSFNAVVTEVGDVVFWSVRKDDERLYFGKTVSFEEGQGKSLATMRKLCL